MAAEFRLLGPLEVLRDGQPVPLRAAKQRALLAALLVHRGKIVSVDTLVENLWQESPPVGARHALEAQASRLRAALGDAAALVAQPPGYVLDADPGSIDAVRFERLLAEAREAGAADPARAAARAADALALWRGPALADFTYELFAQAEIARLEQLRWDALELRIDADLALGRSDLVAELEGLVATEPLRERLRAQLMLALYREGRQADALAAYRDARATLVEELGVEPGPELRALEAAILRHDEALVLPAQSSVPVQRKLATILFADLADSTALAVSLDPETLRTVLRRYFEAVSAAVAQHGGTLEKFIGDAVVAVFGTPLAHEDDTLRAVRAAVDVRAAVAGLDESLERELEVSLGVRVGLATGEVLAGGAPGEPLATGQAVTVAARLQQEGGPGEITVDELTRRLTAGACRFEALAELDLRGLRRPVPAFRLVELVPGASPVARRLDAPLVGRDRDLAVLREAYASALSERALHTVTVVGAAGIGKSRLTRELVDALAGEATVLVGRCLSYGESVTFQPLRDALGSADGVTAALRGQPDAAAIAARLEAVFRSDTAVPADEVPWAFRRYCETLAAARPLVLALDDLHWAEPALLDLVEYLAASSNEAPILLVCVARDELAAERPGFPGAGEHVTLEPLSDEETDALVDHLLPESALDPETRGHLVARAEGNPLFLEQLVAHMAETGRLELPPTLRALLAARLDRLGPGERSVLERAAIVGRDFALGDVTGLLDAAVATTASAHLDVLVRRGFLLPAHDGSFRFRHGLIHDAAYRSAPKALRAELHERLADILARKGADDELVGYHLEQAYLVRTTLAPADRHAQRLAEDAGRRLGAAGIRAWKRGEAGGASNLLSRSATLLPAADEERRELLCELGIALNTAGESVRAAAALEEAASIAARAGDRRVELRARMEQLARRLLDEAGAATELLELVEQAIPLFESLGDHRSLGRAWMLAGWVQGGTYARHVEWRHSAERALVEYRSAGWPPATCVGQIAAAAYGGPTHAAAGAARCLELLQNDVDDRAGEANVTAHLGGFEAMLGRFDEAEASLARSRSLYLDLGRAPTVITTVAPIQAAAARLAGKPEAAEAILQGSCASLKESHLWFNLATQAAELADVLALLGRDAEANAWCEIAKRRALDEDLGAQIAWRVAAARSLTNVGRTKKALTVAREAVALAAATDAVNLRATVYLVLARALGAAGDAAGAENAFCTALRLFEEKGNAAAVARASAERAAAAFF
jgi:DNA-binding SARP family transcriptional activator